MRTHTHTHVPYMHKCRRFITACCVISLLHCETSSKLIPDETTTCQDGFNLSTNLGPYLLKLDWYIWPRAYLTFSCVSIPVNLAILPSKKRSGEHPHHGKSKKVWRPSSWYLNGTIGKWCVFFSTHGIRFFARSFWKVPGVERCIAAGPVSTPVGQRQGGLGGVTMGGTTPKRWRFDL